MAKKKIKKTPLWLLFKTKQVGKGGEREKKKIVFPFRSNPTGNRKFQKKRKKIKKYRCGFISCQNRLENAEKEKKIKIVFPFPSDRIGNRKFKKNQKIQLWLHFKPKQDGKGSERENKNFRFVSFRTNALEKIQEKQQKNSIN